MFEGVQAYQGNLVDLPREDVVELEEYCEPPQEHLTSTSDEILRAAKEEAAMILATAQGEANEQGAAIISKANAEAEKIVTLGVLEKVTKLNLELWSSRIAMVDIIKQALERVIGEIGYDKAALMAVETSLRAYRGEHKLSVIANGRTIERLQLIAIGRKNDLDLMGVELVRDPLMEEGRCILSTGPETVEVGLESQLAAIKKLLDSDREIAAGLAHSGNRSNPELK